MGETNHFYVAFSFQPIQQMILSYTQHILKVPPKRGDFSKIFSEIFAQTETASTRQNSFIPKDLSVANLSKPNFLQRMTIDPVNMRTDFQGRSSSSLNIKMFQVTGYSGEILNRLYGFFRRDFPAGVLYRRSVQLASKYIAFQMFDTFQISGKRFIIWPGSQFARLFPTGFPKSSVLDGDFVLLDTDRKGFIDFRGLILACRSRTLKNQGKPF